MLSNYFATRRHVVFCVFRGIAKLKKEGIFAGVLINNWQYWPALVQGQGFGEHFEWKEVSNTDVVSGKLNGTDYFIWDMKEPNYVMTIMGCGGSLNSKGCKEVQRKWKKGNQSCTKKFSYTKPFQLNFLYHHIVDEHNHLWHALQSIEDTWRTDSLHSFLNCVR